MGTASREFEGCGLWRLTAWKLSKKKAKTQDSLKIVLEHELVTRPDKPQAVPKTFTFEALTSYLELSFPSPLKSEFPTSRQTPSVQAASQAETLSLNPTSSSPEKSKVAAAANA